MPEIYKQKIMKVLRHDDYKPVRVSALAKTLGVESDDYPAFKESLQELRRAGHVVVGVKNLVSLPAMSGRIVGTFRANAKGFGFIVPLEANAHGDLFVPAKETKGAMTGDIVVAKPVKRSPRSGKYSGKIVEILERSEDRFVGTLIKSQYGWIVQPDGSAFVEPIHVEDVGAKNANENDKVVVEIISFPSQEFLAKGVIVEVLGKAGQYDAEIESVIRQFHLPCGFDKTLLNQARKTAQTFDAENMEHREDISDKVILTIDPVDARDFDDAISVERNDQGHWILGVHIADVSTFVKPDSPLDEEAKLRGNSVYLPGRVLPMLPEVLSNGVCSLQPNEYRYAKSAFITYDKNANVIARHFANTRIKSCQRLTYQQANKALRGKAKDIKPEALALLKDMEHLAKRIEKRRRDAGMIHLDLPEMELVMNKSGRVVDAKPADTSYPHTIIEMFMVEANEALASLLNGKTIPFIRRIHPEPDPLTLKNLSIFLRAFGINAPKTPTRETLQQILEAVQKKDISLSVNMAVLKSFAKAVYSPLNSGHWALASRHYCHFTSPIRRYADLTVHRLLDDLLRNGKISDAPDETDLTELGKHISFTEQRAENAERELKTVLILEMLSEHVGDEFDAVVSGLMGFGVFVQCVKYGVEGLIRFEDLGYDKWQLNQKTHCVIGERSGTILRLGDKIRVRISSVNVPARQLNLLPVEPLANEEKKTRKTKSRKKSRKGQGRRSKSYRNKRKR